MLKILYRLPIILLLAGLLLASGCTAQVHQPEKSVGSSSSPAVNTLPVNRSEEKPPTQVVKPAQSSAPVTAQQTAKPLKPSPTGGTKVEGVTISATGEGKTFFTLTNFPIQSGESVFTVTKRAAEKTGVTLNITGAAFTAYVAGIGGLQEFDRGPMSGWIYKVNGIYPNIGAGTYKLKPRDQIEWIYSTGEQKLN